MSAEDLLKELLALQERGVVLKNLKLISSTPKEEISRVEIAFVFPNWCLKIY